jgi:dihydroflavonol-4-reductase
MKILVTGITGLLGSYLTKELAALGELHGLRRKDSKLDLLGDLCDRIIWHEGDINDLASLEEAFEGVDMVVHAAGFISYHPKDKEELIRINVEGTANVVNVMLQKNIKKLIHISSVAALGRAPQVSFIDENFKWVTSPLNTPYGTSKYLGELEVWRAAQEGLDVMVFNPSVLLSKITDRRSSTAIYNYVLKENRYYPLGHINYIDVRDAAKLVRRLYELGHWNNRYVLNKESISYQMFFQKMGEAFEKKPPTVPVSSWMMHVALLGLRIGNLFRKRDVPITSQTMKLSQQSITFGNEKATKTTDFEYTPLETTFAWAAGN